MKIKEAYRQSSYSGPTANKIYWLKSFIFMVEGYYDTKFKQDLFEPVDEVEVSWAVHYFVHSTYPWGTMPPNFNAEDDIARRLLPWIRK